MNIRKPTITNIYIFIGVILVVLFLSIFITKLLKSDNNEFSPNGVITENGVQVITLNAGLGYSPNRIAAQSSIPTKLEIKTNNTYDCTAYLNIPQLNIKKFLPPTGTTEIDLSSRESGEVIEGYCGSDTYKFVIKFS